MKNVNAFDILKNFTIVLDRWEPSCSYDTYNRREDLRSSCGYDTFINDIMDEVIDSHGDMSRTVSLRSALERNLMDLDVCEHRINKITRSTVIAAYQEKLRGIIRHLVLKSDKGSLEVALVYPLGNLVPSHCKRFSYYGNGEKNAPAAKIYIKPQIFCQVVDGDERGLNTNYYQDDYWEQPDIYFLPNMFPSYSGERNYRFYLNAAFDPCETDNHLVEDLAHRIDNHLLRAIIYALGEKGVITVGTCSTVLEAQIKGTSIEKEHPFGKDWDDITKDCIKMLKLKQERINAAINKVCGE